MNKKIKNGSDNSSDSSEINDDYENDSFLVEDDLDDDSDYDEKPIKKKIKKKSKKRRKMDEETLQFLRDQENEKNESRGGRLVKKNFQENKSEESSIKEKEESEIIEDISVKEKNLIKIFDPEDLKEHFMTEKDQNIILKDIPERLQLRFLSFEDKNETYFQEESIWLTESLIHIHKLDIKEMNSLQKKVLKILEFLRIGNYEIIYIWQHKIHELDLKEDNDKDVYKLKLEDFWFIYDNDLNWPMIYQFKNILRMLLSNLEIYENIDPDIVKSFEKCYDLKILQFFYDFILFRMKKYMNEIEINEKIIEINNSYFNIQNVEVKKTIKKNNIKYLFENEQIKEVLNKIALSAEQFYENLSKQKLINKPEIDNNIDIAYLFSNFVNTDIPLLSKVEKVFMYLVEYKALEYFNYPLIKRHLKKLYQEKILICTEPTEIGEKNINCYNYFYPTKRIYNLRAIDINPELWFLCKEAEEKKLIKIKFKFNWDKIEKDEIRNHLMDYFTLSTKNFKEYNKNFNIDIIDSWNHFRERIIEKFLKKYIYPDMEKQLIEDINSFSEEVIIKKCVKKFRNIINIKPYKKLMNEETNFDSNLDEIIESYKQYELKVISIIINDNDSNNGMFVYIDELGIMKKYIKIENIIKKNDQQKRGLSLIDKEKIMDFLNNNFPDVIVMKANSIITQNLKKDINSLLQEIYEDLKIDNDNLNSPFILWNTNDISSIYSKTILGKREFKELDENIIECISMARYIQNPLAETLQLLNFKIEDNYLLYLKFHPSQEFVNKSILKNELEKVIIEVVNDVGIDINIVLKYPHFSKTLQFVSGFGPRKAHNFISKVNTKLGNIKTRLEIKEFLGKNVYTNSIASFQIKNVFIDNEISLTYDLNPLDFTRIHPDNYQIIYKFTSDIEEIELKNDLGEEELKASMKKIYNRITDFLHKPKQLKELDFEDFEVHLSSNKTYNMTLLLNKIEKEINHPFKDNRSNYETKTKREELFYKITNTSKYRIMEESITSCKIVKIESKMVKILIDNSIPGIVLLQDLKERNFEIREDEIENFFNTNEFYMGKIKNIEFDMFRARCSFRPDDLTNHKEFLRKNDILGQYELFDNINFFIDKNKDYPITQNVERKKKIMKFVPRKINHPKFKNMAYGTCLEFLKERAIGEYLFRPSSKGKDNINLTWKFYFNNFVNLDIKEGYKGLNDKISSILKLDKEEYESIDEIIKIYIEPCNLFLNKCIENKNFSKRNINEIIEILINEYNESYDYNNNENEIFYYLSIVSQMPQYVILSYIIQRNNVIHESIKIKRDGYYFHHQKFSNFNNLIRYFKENYNNSDYKIYLEKLPPLNIGQSDNIIKKEEFKLGKKEFIKEEYYDERYKRRRRYHENDYNYRDKYREKDKYNYKKRSRYNSYSSDEIYEKKEFSPKKEYIENNNEYQFNNMNN